MGDPLPEADVQAWRASFPTLGGLSGPPAGRPSANALQAQLYTKQGVLRLLETCATWKVAVEALTVALDDYYDVRWGKPYDHTGTNIKSEVMPMQLMRRVVRSILATGVVVYKSTAKGIEVAEPFEFELVFTGSASNPRLVARLPGDHLRSARRPGPSAWKVAVWSRPKHPVNNVGPAFGNKGRLLQDQPVKFDQYRSPCKDALVDTVRLIMLENNHVRRDWHNSRPAVITHFDLKAAAGATRPWFDGVAQAPNAYPEIDVDADFQLLLGNRVDTIKALDQEHEMMRTTGVAAMHTRETALDDTDPLAGLEVGKRGHNEHRVTDGHTPKMSVAPLASLNDAIYVHTMIRANVLQQMLTPPQAIGEVTTGERQASTGLAYRAALARFEHNVRGIAATLDDMLAESTSATANSAGVDPAVARTLDDVRAYMCDRITVRKLTLVAGILTPEACRDQLSEKFGIPRDDIDLDKLAEAQQAHVTNGNIFAFEPLVRTDRIA